MHASKMQARQLVCALELQRLALQAKQLGLIESAQTRIVTTPQLLLQHILQGTRSLLQLISTFADSTRSLLALSCNSNRICHHLEHHEVVNGCSRDS